MIPTCTGGTGFRPSAPRACGDDPMGARAVATTCTCSLRTRGRSPGLRAAQVASRCFAYAEVTPRSWR
ncbi:hypothetical protein C1I95_12125 [Micromonospora craterilacus]|uniref:Uncharacterized protein n=1 Tax=Micromonospora craterilacus TaxID=1655439 RepID=A0A2W2E9S9_9ACTN|nr:hypothetical protein C1I95_12125 [Micromonospora craterilacus]